MTKLYTITLNKDVPILHKDGRHWLFDLGCPFSTGDWRAPLISEGTKTFLGEPDLQMMGRDMMGKYVYIDFESRLVATSDERMEMDGGEAVAAAVRERNGDILVRVRINGEIKTLVLDTGAPISYMNNVNLNGIPRKEEMAEDNDFSGRTWRTPVKEVRMSLDGVVGEFPVSVGAFNPNRVPYDGVLGADFFHCYKTVIKMTSENGPSVWISKTK